MNKKNIKDITEGLPYILSTLSYLSDQDEIETSCDFCNNIAINDIYCFTHEEFIKESPIPFCNYACDLCSLELENHSTLVPK